MEKLYTVCKNKTGSWLWLRSWAPYCKFRLKLRKVGKATRPFRYDLNQNPYDYTVQVRNGFKGLDLIDRVPKNYGQRFMTLYKRQELRPSSRKIVVWGGLIAEKRNEAKGRGEKERYTHLNAEFQRIARRDQKAFLSDQCKKKQRKTIEWERLEMSSRKLEIPRQHFMQRWAR